MTTAMKIKKGDTVLVLKGKDSGKRGKVVSTMPKLGKVMIDGVNQRIRHIRPRKQGEKGKMIEIAHPIHVSNVKLVSK